MKHSIVILLILASTGTMMAQRLELIRPEAYNGIFVPIDRTLNYNDIEGSPYLDNDLIKGYVKFTLGDSAVQFLRYNIYSDEMEFLKDKNLLVIDNVNALDHVYVNNHFFFYKTYKFRNSFKEGYLEKLVAGKYELYVKYQVDFEERKPPRSSYDKAIPDRFVVKSPTYYFAIANGPIKNFETDNSALEEIFMDKFPALESYMKSEKLKPRKQEDLVRVFDFANKEFSGQ